MHNALWSLNMFTKPVVIARFLPPLRLDRRMWAGGALRYYAPLRIGDPYHAPVCHPKRHAKTGKLVFVTIDHETRGPKGLAIEERQNIV